MGLFSQRTYDYKQEHKELDHEPGRIFCPHCGKTVEERDMPDYGMFMGGVWIKQNLPCKPYKKPTPQKGKDNE